MSMRAFFALVLITVFVASPCFAITSGETVYDAISEQGEVDTYEFTASAGDLATILFSSTQSDTDIPYFELLAPDGTAIAGAGGVCRSVWLLQQSLPQNGTYRILCQASEGYNTFEYGLSLVLQPGSTISDADPDGGLIASGETRDGSIASADLDTYEFTAAAGDLATILLSTQYDTDIPYFELLAPDGTAIVGTGGYRSICLLQQSLPQNGTYRILCRAYDGYNAFDYALTLHLNGQPRAVDDTYTASFNAATMIAAPGVLANDVTSGPAMAAKLEGSSRGVLPRDK